MERGEVVRDFVRQSNETIARVARETSLDAPVPFICECGDASCREIVRVMPADYENVRRTSTHFFVVAGHESRPGVFGRVVTWAGA